MYSKLQYISQGNTLQEQQKNIQKALENGADWIQIRWKNSMPDELFSLCKNALVSCRKYNAVCIINDHIQIAKELDADGVHLGLNDDSIKKAKSILGDSKIIGGTANTISDVLKRIDEGCDYIGLGPFRFTTTKENLSPILGLSGYGKIIQYLKEHQTKVPPIYAVGGIELQDLEAVKATGIYGIAVSGMITQEPLNIQKIKEKLA